MSRPPRPAPDGMSVGSTDDAVPSETERIDPVLTGALKDVGIDGDKVDEFAALLKQCNVLTMGALRLFAMEVHAIVNMMYETETPLGKLQAQGFLAALRVCARSAPCRPLFSLHSKR